MYKQRSGKTVTLFSLSDKEILCRKLSLLAEVAIKDATLCLNRSDRDTYYNKRQLLFTANLINLCLERCASSSTIDCGEIAGQVFELVRTGNLREIFYQDVFAIIERYINFDSSPGLDAKPSSGV